MRAAYFPPYVFASSGFFVQKKQMTSIKTHMAYNSFGNNTLSDKRDDQSSLFLPFTIPHGEPRKLKCLFCRREE